MSYLLVRSKLIFAFFFILLLNNSLQAGNGASHPMLGALTAKYLAFNQQETRGEKFLSYSSAFLIGMTSHLVSDHYGNFEPRSGTWEMTYFSVEGLMGGIFLYPQWKKDKRLFWGSLGGMLPDIEHAIRFYDKRIFPTHNGTIPHGERKNFWQGAFENLLINSVSYYLIANHFPVDQSKGNIWFGTRMTLWDGGEATNHRLSTTFLNTINPTSLEFALRVPVKKGVYFESSFSSWMERLTNDTENEIPPRRVIQSFYTSLQFHRLKSNTRISPFIGMGLGFFIWGGANSVDSGGISFFQCKENELDFISSLGVDFRLFENTIISTSIRYQSSRHLHTSSRKDYIPEWQPALTMYYKI